VHDVDIVHNPRDPNKEVPYAQVFGTCSFDDNAALTLVDLVGQRHARKQLVTCGLSGGVVLSVKAVTGTYTAKHLQVLVALHDDLELFVVGPA